MTRRLSPAASPRPATWKLLWVCLRDATRLGAIAALLTVALLTSERPARAGLSVDTPHGNCLHARRQPRIAPGNIVACVRDGAPLKPAIASRDGWLQLSSGNWVYAAHTKASGSGGRLAVYPGLLRPGNDPSAAIARVQRQLLQQGYAIANLGLGTFGPSTEQAVRAFQRDRGLATDGWVGPKTWAALFPTGWRTASPPPGVLRRGSPQTAAVERVQRALTQQGYAIPGLGFGRFGPNTEAAVRAFQRDRGLRADGIVGPRTQVALFSGTGGAQRDRRPAAAAARSPEPVAVDLTASALPSGPMRLGVPVTVGAQTFNVQLDTSSSGLRVWEDVLDREQAQLRPLNQREVYRDRQGNVWEGYLALADLRISNVAATAPLEIHVVQQVRCAPGATACEAELKAAGFAGNLGIAPNADDAALPNPLTGLPAPLAGGYALSTGGRSAARSQLLLGLTAADWQAFAMLPEAATRDLAYTLIEPNLGETLQFRSPTEFDTSSSDLVVQVPPDWLPEARPIAVNGGVALSVDWPAAIADFQTRSEQLPAAYRIVLAPEGDRPSRLGLPFFWEYDVAFEPGTGKIGLRRRSEQTAR